MFDMHYDLLTKIYMCYRENDFSYIEKWIKNYNCSNVRGVIANMCFMSEEEMREEYHPKYYVENVSAVEMFKIATYYLKKYLPDNINILTSIEGCDYLEVSDLETLKELGLNAIVPVWNNKSRYGSGNRSDSGLTLEGEKLIKKAIELNLGIDLSHANEKTFFDIIDIINEQRQKGINPVVYASHSNVRSLSDEPRNLTDKQILAIKSVGGVVGLVSHSKFTLKGSLNKRLNLKGNAYDDFLKLVRETYIKHIIYINRLLGDTDSIAVSTDDMTFVETDPDYKECPIFDYSNIGLELNQLLSKYYSKDIVDNIMFNNAYKIYERLIQEKVKTK